MSLARLGADRCLVGYALAGGLAFSALFAYIVGSSFVFQNLYGASPQLFSLFIGANALGFVGVGQVNGYVAGRFSSRTLLAVGLLLQNVAALVLLGVTLLAPPSLIALALPLFFVAASMG